MNREIQLSKRILAVASGGGHWVQLMRLSPVLEGLDVAYVTTLAGLCPKMPGRLYLVADANRWEKLKMMLMMIQVIFVLLRERPAVVLTTGASAGMAAVVFGRFIGAKTIWIDSIANTEEISGSGTIARRFASVCLTQWPHLAASERGIDYWGAVL